MEGMKGLWKMLKAEGSMLQSSSYAEASEDKGARIKLRQGIFWGEGGPERRKEECRRQMFQAGISGYLRLFTLIYG
jgi:hypothetical protein